MSAPPILPGMNQASAPARETPAQAPSTSVPPVKEVARTLTTSAVQQAQASSESDDLARLKRAILEDKRARLVGPSPAFQVSLLQHLHETQGDPPAEVETTAETPPAAQENTPEAPDRWGDNASYKTLQGMSDTDGTRDPAFKHSI
ncbi:hypothetical protein [Roseinatronobacter sp.]|uniref:hypothetical protein n=1 Tax=Roseinatronobacter sp. TaxID=1945755 RepID=UPI0025F548EF|nr:hypothetical protein [Rhodobaca sp.]